MTMLSEEKDTSAHSALQMLKDKTYEQLTIESKKILEGWEQLREQYKGDRFVTKIRDKEIVTILRTKSLSGLEIPKVALPSYKDYGEIIKWVYKENVPGSFPYTAGVFPFKREGEDEETICR